MTPVNLLTSCYFPRSLHLFVWGLTEETQSCSTGRPGATSASNLSTYPYIFFFFYTDPHINGVTQSLVHFRIWTSNLLARSAVQPFPGVSILSDGLLCVYAPNVKPSRMQKEQQAENLAMLYLNMILLFTCGYVMYTESCIFRSLQRNNTTRIHLFSRKVCWVLLTDLHIQYQTQYTLAL